MPGSCAGKKSCGRHQDSDSNGSELWQLKLSYMYINLNTYIIIYIYTYYIIYVDTLEVVPIIENGGEPFG